MLASSATVCFFGLGDAVRPRGLIVGIGVARIVEGDLERGRLHVDEADKRADRQDAVVAMRFGQREQEGQEAGISALFHDGFVVVYGVRSGSLRVASHAALAPDW